VFTQSIPREIEVELDKSDSNRFKKISLPQIRDIEGDAISASVDTKDGDDLLWLRIIEAKYGEYYLRFDKELV